MAHGAMKMSSAGPHAGNPAALGNFGCGGVTRSGQQSWLIWAIFLLFCLTTSAQSRRNQNPPIVSKSL